MLREQIRDLEEISEIRVYTHEYLGNRFLIALLPGEGSFEWIEIWHPMSVWANAASKPILWVVREDPLGRATAMDGGFSAARLAVLEHLASIRRRADALIVREILPTYYAPVGNWHIRESVRLALSKRPETVNGREELASFISRWLKADPSYVFQSSYLLSLIKRQRKLTEYMRGQDLT
jgi:Uncharacterized conserved protein